MENKPQWLLDINPKGTVPIIHDLEKDKWVPGVYAGGVFVSQTCFIKYTLQQTMQDW